MIGLVVLCTYNKVVLVLLFILEPWSNSVSLNSCGASIRERISYRPVAVLIDFESNLSCVSQNFINLSCFEGELEFTVFTNSLSVDQTEGRRLLTVIHAGNRNFWAVLDQLNERFLNFRLHGDLTFKINCLASGDAPWTEESNRLIWIWHSNSWIIHDENILFDLFALDTGNLGADIWIEALVQTQSVVFVVFNKSRYLSLSSIEFTIEGGLSVSNVVITVINSLLSVIVELSFKRWLV